jgi:hypothetical protein
MCRKWAPRSMSDAISSISPLCFFPPIFTPHDVGGFSLRGAAEGVAALLSAELDEGAEDGTNPGGSPSECAGGLPPMLPPKGELEEGSGGVEAARSDDLPDECATGGLPPMFIPREEG